MESLNRVFFFFCISHRPYTVHLAIYIYCCIFILLIQYFNSSFTHYSTNHITSRSKSNLADLLTCSSRSSYSNETHRKMSLLLLRKNSAFNPTSRKVWPQDGVILSWNHHTNAHLWAFRNTHDNTCICTPPTDGILHMATSTAYIVSLTALWAWLT